MTMAKADSTPAFGASRSIYYSLTDEVPGLTEEEKNKLETVMKKAMEFEAEEASKLRQPLEGQLYKYTNVMKGWQYRWFVLTPDTGLLEYYMLDERKKSRPRGALCLAGAAVIPSEEDNHSFVVSAVCGEMYKLKANDTKERQVWVDKIRTVIERHLSVSPNFLKADGSVKDQSSFALCKNSPSIVCDETQCLPLNLSPDKINEVPQMPVETDPVTEIKESVHKALECQKALAKSIEGLPYSGPHIKCSDNKLLLMKAISQASVQSLEQCYLIFRSHKQKEAIGASVDNLDRFRGVSAKSDIKRVESLKNV